MRRFAKAMIILAVAAVLLLLGGWWVLIGSPMPPIPPARTEAPSNFDAWAYVELSSLSSNNQVEVLALNAFGDPFEHYTIPDLGVTYFILFDPDGMRRMVFFNSLGELIGDITDQPQLFPMGHFVVTPDGYYEITSAGVSSRHSIPDVTVASTLELERMIEDSSHYRYYGGSDFPTNDMGGSSNPRLHVMRHEGTWKRVVSEEQRFFDLKGAPFHRLNALTCVARALDATSTQSFFGGRYQVELTHFDQREFRPRRGAPIGSPTGQGRPAQWIGTGYYTLFIDDDPALRFRLEDDREVLDGGGPVNLIIHGGAALDFIVIERVDRRGASQVFLVRASRT
jgi:hypothetical protein